MNLRASIALLPFALAACAWSTGSALTERAPASVPVVACSGAVRGGVAEAPRQATGGEYTEIRGVVTAALETNIGQIPALVLDP